MDNVTKTIDGKAYEVRELRLRDVQDLLGQEGVNFSVELFKRAVLLNGAVLGDAADDLPLREYTVLAKVVNELNAARDEPGNESSP